MYLKKSFTSMSCFLSGQCGGDRTTHKGAPKWGILQESGLAQSEIHSYDWHIWPVAGTISCVLGMHGASMADSAEAALQVKGT